MSAVMEFIDDDNGYQKWIGAHPDGYVLNTTRRIDPSYMVLHKATCPSVTNYTDMAKTGGFTERDYIKACGETIAVLQKWAKGHGRPDGDFSSECGRCKP